MVAGCSSEPRPPVIGLAAAGRAPSASSAECRSHHFRQQVHESRVMVGKARRRIPRGPSATGGRRQSSDTAARFTESSEGALPSGTEHRVDIQLARYATRPTSAVQKLQRPAPLGMVLMHRGHSRVVTSTARARRKAWVQGVVATPISGGVAMQPGRLGCPRRLKREYWRLIATGMQSDAASRKLGLTRTTGIRWFGEAGGVPPAWRRPSPPRVERQRGNQLVHPPATPQGSGLRMSSATVAT